MYQTVAKMDCDKFCLISQVRLKPNDISYYYESQMPIFTKLLAASKDVGFGKVPLEQSTFVKELPKKIL